MIMRLLAVIFYVATLVRPDHDRLSPSPSLEAQHREPRQQIAVAGDSVRKITMGEWLRRKDEGHRC